MRTVLATLIGLAVTAFANPATAYVIQLTTSIPVTSTADEAQLKHAVDSMMGDVLNHAIAFAPTVVIVQHTRVVGDRIYILLLIADEDGEETMKKLAGEAPTASDSPREGEPSGGGDRY